MSAQLPAVIDRTKIIGEARAPVVPALIAAGGERASLRFLEFFTANIRNPHTRRAYSRAVLEFITWCEDNGVTSITAVQPLHVSAWIEQQTREHAAPTAKLRLAALHPQPCARPSRSCPRAVDHPSGRYAEGIQTAIEYR
jgi:Phage integrase, N-terminal SAM-like domain